MLAGTAVVRLDASQFEVFSRLVRTVAKDPTHQDYGICRELLPVVACAESVSVRIRVSPPRHVRGVGRP